jgi:hypothetical protein
MHHHRHREDVARRFRHEVLEDVLGAAQSIVANSMRLRAMAGRSYNIVAVEPVALPWHTPEEMETLF